MFNGPSFKIWSTSDKIRIYASFEYEDLAQELVARSLPDEEPIQIRGTLISRRDVSDVVTSLGLDWEVVESSGKSKNYKAKFDDTVTKSNLLEAIEAFRGNSYFLVSFHANGEISCKKKVPRPSKSSSGDEDGKSMNFCKGWLPNNTRNLNMVLDAVIPDFINDLPRDWNKVTLDNRYKITAIELPDDRPSSSLVLRLMAVRKGKWYRSLDVDGYIIEKQRDIRV